MKIILCLFLLTGCALKSNSQARWHGCHGGFGIAYNESFDEATKSKEK